MRRAKSNAPFALYLRPFALDYSVHALHTASAAFDDMSARRRGHTPGFEEILTAGVSDLAGTRLDWICLGRPGEFEGAGRIATDSENWRSEVETLADAARVIVLVISARAGTRWEVEQVLQRDWLKKTVFVIPPDRADFSLEGGYVSDVDFNHGCEPLRQRGFTTPAYTKVGALFFYADGERRPTTLVMDRDFAEPAAAHATKAHLRSLVPHQFRVPRDWFAYVLTSLVGLVGLAFWGSYAFDLAAIELEWAPYLESRNMSPGTYALNVAREEPVLRKTARALAALLGVLGALTLFVRHKSAGPLLAGAVFFVSIAFLAFNYYTSRLLLDGVFTGWLTFCIVPLLLAFIGFVSARRSRSTF